MILFRESIPPSTYEPCTCRRAGAVACATAGCHAGRHQPRQERDRGRRGCAESAGARAEASRAASSHPASSDGDRVAIEVIDNGTGLPKQNRTRLLEPYVTTKGSKGTGLGLAIVQKIIEQHGGTLSSRTRRRAA